MVYAFAERFIVRIRKVRLENKENLERTKVEKREW